MTITFGAAKKEGGGLGEQWSEASDKSLIQCRKFLIYSYLLFFLSYAAYFRKTLFDDKVQ